MTDELKSIRKNTIVALTLALFRNLPRGTEKDQEKLRTDIRYPGRASNRVPPEYKSGAYESIQSTNHRTSCHVYGRKVLCKYTVIDFLGIIHGPGFV
jgi:hypothetical protein